MEWYESLSDLTEFGHALLDADHISTVNSFDLLYFFENPQKWAPEHYVWVSHGSPTPEDEDENWGLFVTALETLDDGPSC